MFVMLLSIALPSTTFMRSVRRWTMSGEISVAASAKKTCWSSLHYWKKQKAMQTVAALTTNYPRLWVPNLRAPTKVRTSHSTWRNLRNITKNFTFTCSAATGARRGSIHYTWESVSTRSARVKIISEWTINQIRRSGKNVFRYLQHNTTGVQKCPK